ncbi:conserved hypothetical protein [delta proteobacterium NaphS2]|nr:conserved hypothetical protein [delta proteobacterium NaphS2]
MIGLHPKLPKMTSMNCERKIYPGGHDALLIGSPGQGKV